MRIKNRAMCASLHTDIHTYIRLCSIPIFTSDVGDAGCRPAKDTEFRLSCAFNRSPHHRGARADRPGRRLSEAEFCVSHTAQRHSQSRVSHRHLKGENRFNKCNIGTHRYTRE